MKSLVRRKVSSPRYADLVVHANIARWIEVANDTSQDAKGQVSQILSQIDQMLAELDCQRSDLLEVVIYLADLDDVPTLNQAWDAWVDPNNPPSRACVGVQLQGELKAEFVLRVAVS